VTPRGPQLETERLVLRRWRELDLEPFAAMNADAEVMEFFPAPLTRVQSDALAARADGGFETRGFGLWALELRATGEFIGFTGLAPLPEEVGPTGGVEVGWRLACPFWGAGYATEAARAALDSAFGTLGLAEVSSITAVLNVRSQAVMRRIGMHEIESFEHPRVPEASRLRPHVRFVIDRPV